MCIAKWTLLTTGLLGTAGGIVGLALHHHPALDRPIEGDVFGDRFRSLPQGAVFLSLGIAALGGTLALGRYERKLSKQAREDEAAAVQRIEPCSRASRRRWAERDRRLEAARQLRSQRRAGLRYASPSPQPRPLEVACAWARSSLSLNPPGQPGAEPIHQRMQGRQHRPGAISTDS